MKPPSRWSSILKGRAVIKAQHPSRRWESIRSVQCSLRPRERIWVGAARQLEVGAATTLPVVIARLVKWIEDFCKAVDFWASRGGAYDRYPLQQDRAVPALLKPPRAS